MKAHLTLGEHGVLVAQLETGERILAKNSEKMSQQLHLAGVTTESLTVADWKTNSDHAPMSGLIMRHFHEMIIFLDFDGVLHPECCESDQLFCRTEPLWQILRECPDVQVVFSTSWREVHQPEELRDFVTHGGGEDLAHRFIGSTPILESSEHRYKREAECREWLRINSCEERPWLALDDTDFWFEGTNLYLVDYRIGLTEVDVAAIIKKIHIWVLGRMIEILTNPRGMTWTVNSLAGNLAA
jgi:hypothetical protein